MSARTQGLRLVSFTMVLLVLGLAATTSADTIYVCWDGSGDYLTIQEGMDAANDGDEVVVCDGTYTGDGNRDLDYGGRLITVRSENGPESCIINCQGSSNDPHRAFRFHNGETDAAVVRGFTIRNGYSHYADGAGIDCRSNSSPTIDNCTITSGRAFYGHGGGICCYGASPTILNCRIVGNRATYEGGGISCEYSNALIANCTISANWDVRYGGGIYSSWSSSPTIVNCEVSYNSVRTWDGGGIWAGEGSARIANCVIVGNTAPGHGGGIGWCTWDGAVATNCTIYGNTASYGGGIACYGARGIDVSSLIIWGNSASHGAQVAVVRSYVSASDLTVTHSDVEGGQAGVFVEGGCSLYWGPGNIDDDPFLVDPADADYHLSAGSPCIDAGCNGGVPPDTADLDDDGEGRFFDDPDMPDTGCGFVPIVDMGAYEFGDTGLQPCPGDMDGDQDVDQSDLGILLAAWGNSDTCDLDCDGDIDQGDLGILLGHWGEGCP